jgi:hypothetical protein
MYKQELKTAHNIYTSCKLVGVMNVVCRHSAHQRMHADINLLGLCEGKTWKMDA